MKSVRLIVATVLLLPLSVAFADTLDTSLSLGRGQRLDEIAKALSLSSDQKDKLETIFKEEREKLLEIHEDSHARIKEVLSGEQIIQWDEMTRQHKEPRR